MKIVPLIFVKENIPVVQIFVNGSDCISDKLLEELGIFIYDKGMFKK